MKSTPPPPVDRIQRQVNPLALAILIVCLAGALLAFYLAPNAAGATLMTWMIVILAVCGAFGLLLFAFGLLQVPTRSARFDTTKAIAELELRTASSSPISSRASSTPTTPTAPSRGRARPPI